MQLNYLLILVHAMDIQSRVTMSMCDRSGIFGQGAELDSSDLCTCTSLTFILQSFSSPEMLENWEVCIVLTQRDKGD